MKISLPKRPTGYQYYPCNLEGRISQLGYGIFWLGGIGIILAGAITGWTTIAMDSAQEWSALTLLQQLILYAVSTAYVAGISLLLMAVLSAFLLLGVHRFADLGVGPKGLVTQVYLIFWREVPWADVVEIRSPSLPRLHSYEKAAIIVKNLTPWHRTLGMMYAGSAMPTILITTCHKNWQELLTSLKRCLAEASSGQEHVF